ncbi:MAG: zinc ribbon domain-containing protein [Oscillospiraceae bacterium]|jgi:ABC-type transporter Mla subunit MlaD|nr:zinc ribbon domain-containing protein [Oscillospiraceae bacterium]
MGLLDDVIVNAKTAADVVGKKASQFADVSKLRISAADLNNEISKRFESLGRAVYEAKKTGSDVSDLVAENVESIDGLYEQLDAVNAQLASARERVICKNCGQENTQDALYCSRCGHRLSEE